MRGHTRIPGGFGTIALVATALLSVLLAGCGIGAGAAASATATATCPPVPTFKSVSGHITAATSGSITVTDASGTATTVTLPTTLRVTRNVAVASTSLKAGTGVLVLTDTNATVAQRISVLPQGAAATGTPGTGSGFGGFGGFGPGGQGGRGASGTPTAGRNRSCFARGGQGQPGQGGGFQGLRGTVDSATSTRLIFEDVQGQTYSVAITSSTVIQQSAQAQISDLTVGKTVMVTGSASASGGITARSVVIQG